MTRRLAVVLVHEGLDDVGGTQQQTCRIAEMLLRQGHHVAFASRWPIPDEGRNVKHLRGLGVPLLVPRRDTGLRRIVPRRYAVLKALRAGSWVLRHRSLDRRSYWSDPRVVASTVAAIDFDAARSIARWLGNQPEPGIAHVLGRHSAGILPALRSRGLRTVFTEFGQAEHFNATYDAVDALGADAYTADSSRAASRLGEQLGRPVHFIPSIGGFTGEGGGSRRPASRLIAVGRLEPEKRFDWLVKALASLPERTSLSIAGEGRDRPRLEGVALAQGVRHRVNFLGSLDRAELQRELEASDVFVLASQSEGTPTSVLEAMSLGLPVVATNVGGLPDLLGYGGGLLVSTEQELTSQLAALLADEAAMRELGGRARLVYRKHFAPQELAPKYLLVYREALTVRR